jgi:WXG100 family type VII secretion target
VSEQFRVEPDALMLTAARVRDAEARIAADAAEVRELFGELRSVWAGSSGRTFEEIAERWFDHAESLREVLSAVADGIAQAGQQYQTVDEQTAHFFSSGIRDALRGDQPDDRGSESS